MIYLQALAGFVMLLLGGDLVVPEAAIAGA